ncbi:glycosyltransferase family 2 protein [Oerskovia sp. Root22]|uniref:glycosyltransferase n=1 Tax=Oerskovia sp. Root22 TaxID=1736494 RepID=UPI0009E8DEBC|nr:glycosyltransferase [Oerskovia sp. Root22]
MVDSVSVVIGFRNWGLGRLAACIDSLMMSTYTGRIEIIVSDYGSDNADEVQAVAVAHGAKYVWSEPVHGWSRSRALNAGYAIATGEVLAVTDADMIFLPTTLATVADHIRAFPLDTVILQCRDLPEGYSDAEIELKEVDWQNLSRVSSIRPRWGMGGFVAHSREVVAEIRGLDERLHTYGGEDIDFGNRCRRAGSRIQWLDHPMAKMFHMWHAPTANNAQTDPSFAKAIKNNREIYTNDRTAVRNGTTNCLVGPSANPVCSIVFKYLEWDATAELSIESILTQSVSAIEVILWGPDQTEMDLRVEDIGDDRVRAIQMSGQSEKDRIAAVLRETRGTYFMWEAESAYYHTSRVADLLAHCIDGIRACEDRTAVLSDLLNVNYVQRERPNMFIHRKTLLGILTSWDSEVAEFGAIADLVALSGARVAESETVGRWMVASRARGVAGRGNVQLDWEGLALGVMDDPVRTSLSEDSAEQLRVPADLAATTVVLVSADVKSLRRVVKRAAYSKITFGEQLEIGTLGGGATILAWKIDELTSGEIMRLQRIAKSQGVSIHPVESSMQNEAAGGERWLEKMVVDVNAAIHGTGRPDEFWLSAMALSSTDSRRMSKLSDDWKQWLPIASVAVKEVRWREQQYLIALGGPLTPGDAADGLLAATMLSGSVSEVRLVGTAAISLTAS